MVKSAALDTSCTIERTNDVVGNRWTPLVLREVFFGNRRFSTLRSRLAIAPDILSARLSALIERGLLMKSAYRDEGARSREEYVLTHSGRALLLVLGAMSEWSRTFDPPVAAGTAVYRESTSGEQVRVAFVTNDGRVLDPDEVQLARD